MSIKRNYKKLVGNSEFEKYEMKNSLEGLNDRDLNWQKKQLANL